jgi:hypothetical protein
VPGRIRRAAFSSGLDGVPSRESSLERSREGDCGPNWTSGMGGGLGSRGEDMGDTPVREGVIAVIVTGGGRARWLMSPPSLP